jgi:hypothetical protein
MHSEIFKFTSGQLYDFTELDDDEVIYENEIDRLMDAINDHGTINQINAMEICKQRNWPVHKEYDPCSYFSDNEGYLYWFDYRNI